MVRSLFTLPGQRQPSLALTLRYGGRNWVLLTAILLTRRSVTSYTTASAELTLQHDFPKGSGSKAFVDVRLLLEKLTIEQTAVGQWVNIIGYIAMPQSGPVRKQSKRKTEASVVYIQALMLWSPGPLDIGRYETSLAEMALTVERESKRRRPNTS